MRSRLSVLMFLNYAAQGCFCPMFSLRLQEELGFDPLVIGLVCSTQALAALATPFAAGQLADRYFPAQRCLAAFSLAAGVLLCLMPYLTSPAAVFVMTLAVWMTMVPASTLCAALAFAHLPRPERDFGFARMCGTLGWAAAGWVVGGWLWLVGRGALGDIFRWGGLLAIALAAYALTMPHTPPQKRGGALAPLAALRRLRTRPFLVYWVCSFGGCLTIPFLGQLSPLLLEKHGVPREWVGPTLTLGQSMEVVALGMLPVLLLRLGTRGTMLLGLFAWVVLFGVMTLGEPIWLVVAALSLNGLFICGFIVAGQVFINSRSHGDVRTSAQSLLTFVNGTGLLAGNLLAGWVRHQAALALAPTFAVAAAAALLLLVIFFIGFREGEATAVGSDDAPETGGIPPEVRPALTPVAPVITE